MQTMSNMEESIPQQALEIFSEEHAKEIVKSVIDTLIDSDFSLMLNSDIDIEFALDPLIYSFKLPEVEGAISIFSRWLIDPSNPAAILNSERYNKYIRQIFDSIPLIFELRKSHTPKALDDTYNFLKFTITPPKENKTSKDWKHPFQPETWNVSLWCLLKSIRITDPKSDSEIRDKLMALFVDGIIISDLEIEEADQLILTFFDFCFITQSNGQLLHYDKYWYKLFNEIFMQFLTFPTDEKKRNFILNLIKKMKTCSKEFDDKCQDNQSTISINWPILEKFFKSAMKCVKQVQNDYLINNIFKPKLPADSIISLFGDCMFVTPFWDFHILDNIKELFSLFSYGEFVRETKWQIIFLKYLCFLMEKKLWNSLFKVVYGIMNTSSHFIAVHPELFSKIMYVLLSKAASIDLPYFTQVSSNNSSVMKPDTIPNPSMLVNGAWVTTMASLLEFSRVDENKSLEDRVLLVIEKFCNCSELPFIIEDFNVYRLILLANAGKEDLFANLIAQEAPTARSLRVERIWDFELLALSVSPLFMPNFVSKIIDKQVIEHILANFKGNEFSDRHIFWFLIVLYELSKSTDLFVRNRAIITPIIAYLSDQKKQRKNSPSNSPKSLNWCICKMIEIVYYSILIPTVSATEVKLFEKKYKTVKNYAINDRVVSLGENEMSATFGAIVRGPFGISSFDITEVATPEKLPAPENTLKENILHRDEIQFPEESVFPVYKDDYEDEKSVKKCVPKSFLIAMGFASIESSMSFNSMQLIDEKSGCEVTNELNEFEKLCDLVSLDVKVASVFEKSESLYDTFLDDLGSSFKFGSCLINFNAKDEKIDGNEVVVIFNESGLKISSKALLEKDETAANNTNNNVSLLKNNLVIEIEPIFNSISKRTLLYKVKILKNKWKCVILPFPTKKPVVTSRNHLPRMIATITFFYFSRLAKDELLGRPTNINANEYECPKIVSKYIEAFEKRKEKLEKLLEMRKKEETIDTILID